MTRQRRADAGVIVALIGLGLLFYGGAFYPPLAWSMAVANLVYLFALAIAWIIGHLPGRHGAASDARLAYTPHPGLEMGIAC